MEIGVDCFDRFPISCIADELRGMDATFECHIPHFQGKRLSIFQPAAPCPLLVVLADVLDYIGKRLTFWSSPVGITAFTLWEPMRLAFDLQLFFSHNEPIFYPFWDILSTVDYFSNDVSQKELIFIDEHNHAEKARDD